MFRLELVVIVSVGAIFGSLGWTHELSNAWIFGLFWGIGVWSFWTLNMYSAGTTVQKTPQTDASLMQLVRVTGFAQTPAILQVFASFAIEPISSFIPYLAVVGYMWVVVAMIAGVHNVFSYQSTLRSIGLVMIGLILVGIEIGLIIVAVIFALWVIFDLILGY